MVLEVSEISAAPLILSEIFQLENLGRKLINRLPASERASGDFKFSRAFTTEIVSDNASSEHGTLKARFEIVSEYASSEHST